MQAQHQLSIYRGERLVGLIASTSNRCPPLPAFSQGKRGRAGSRVSCQRQEQQPAADVQSAAQAGIDSVKHFFNRDAAGDGQPPSDGDGGLQQTLKRPVEVHRQDVVAADLFSSISYDEELQVHTALRGPRSWPKKAELYIVRTDGMSCSRETVRASGCLSFSCPSTQQHLLVWKNKPQCAMVVKKLGEELTQEYLDVLEFLGAQQGLKVIVEPQEFERLQKLKEWDFVDTFTDAEVERLHMYIDFVVCLGGDGVLLHASYLFKRAIPPVISFNLGSLGFLTNHSWQEWRHDILSVIHGSENLEQCAIDGSMKGVHITLRMRLFCEIFRDGEPIEGQQYEVLNEVVVDRGANPFLTKIECFEKGRLITKVQADGLMLATPTGSTAYSVAAGGSMVHPNVPAILFTPVCAHSLSFRPVILPDYAELDLRIPDDARCPAWVCFDGKQRQELLRGDSVRVRMSPNPVPTINKTDQTTDWFASLERCFGWNERVEQKALPDIKKTKAPDNGAKKHTAGQAA